MRFLQYFLAIPLSLQRLGLTIPLPLHLPSRRLFSALKECISLMALTVGVKLTMEEAQQRMSWKIVNRTCYSSLSLINVHHYPNKTIGLTPRAKSPTIPVIFGASRSEDRRKSILDSIATEFPKAILRFPEELPFRIECYVDRSHVRL